MGFSLCLGVWMVETEGDNPSCAWPHNTLPEDDGADPERAAPGEPRRLITWGDLEDWLRAMPKVEALFAEAGWHMRGSMDVVCPLSQVYELIHALPDGRGYNADRIRWLKYWARRAREEYGELAVIQFSV